MPGEFDVYSAPNPLQPGINAMMSGFQLGTKTRERREDMEFKERQAAFYNKRADDQLAISQGNFRLSQMKALGQQKSQAYQDEMSTFNYYLKEKRLNAEVNANHFVVEGGKAALDRRADMHRFGERYRAGAWDPNQGGNPETLIGIPIGREGDKPIFARYPKGHDEEGRIIGITQQQWLDEYSHKNFIDNPEADPSSTNPFRSMKTSEIDERMKTSSTEITRLNEDRMKAYMSSRHLGIDPDKNYLTKRIGSAPTLDLVSQYKNVSELSGLPDASKQSLMNNIDHKYGGLSGAIKYLQSQNASPAKIDWIRKLYIEQTVTPNDDMDGLFSEKYLRDFEGVGEGKLREEFVRSKRKGKFRSREAAIRDRDRGILDQIKTEEGETLSAQKIRGIEREDEFIGEAREVKAEERAKMETELSVDEYSVYEEIINSQGNEFLADYITLKNMSHAEKKKQIRKWIEDPESRGYRGVEAEERPLGLWGQPQPRDILPRGNRISRGTK